MVSELDDYSFEQGWRQGWKEGYDTAVSEYEPELKRYNIELLTLNARISYLERTVGGTK